MWFRLEHEASQINETTSLIDREAQMDSWPGVHEIPLVDYRRFSVPYSATQNADPISRSLSSVPAISNENKVNQHRVSRPSNKVTKYV